MADNQWLEALERVVGRLDAGLEQRLKPPSTPFRKRTKPRTVHEQALRMNSALLARRTCSPPPSKDSQFPRVPHKPI
jgi:hypothetical protein